MIYNHIDLEKKINSVISSLEYRDEPISLFQPIQYILSLGGKRLRPTLAYMSTNLFQDHIEKTTPAAIAIEIFHNFSLLHDDLMDNAKIRRGQPSVHNKWDNNTAVLSGDAMLIDAYRHIIKVEDLHLPEILAIFTTTALEVCQGQQYDMDFEKRNDVKESEYLNMIHLKTAVLLATSLKIGAILGKANKEDANHLYNFGINLGLAFQLKDDLLDVYGNPKEFGKQLGGDIVCNKKTFLLIKALEISESPTKIILNKWLNARNFNPKDKIEAVKKIYDELKLEDMTNDFIEKYYLASLECLSAVNVPDKRKKELINYTDYLMERVR